MERFNQWPMEELLPHSGPMVLLDKVLDYGDDTIAVVKVIKPGEPFVMDGQVATWVGIEYMAQAVGAFAGMRAKLAGEPVKVGLLIGSRKYEADFPWFSVGDRLTITAKQIHEEDSGLCVFECLIDCPAGEVRANLNVFVPDDIDVYLSEDNHE